MSKSKCFIFLDSKIPVLASSLVRPTSRGFSSSTARRLRSVDMLRAVAGARHDSAGLFLHGASSAPCSPSSSCLPPPVRLSCRRRRCGGVERRHIIIIPSALPSPGDGDNEDDEDVRLDLDEVDALTDDELADLLAERNTSRFSEEELLRKVIEPASMFFLLLLLLLFFTPTPNLLSLTPSSSPFFLRLNQTEKNRSRPARTPSAPPSRPSTPILCSKSSSRSGSTPSTAGCGSRPAGARAPRAPRPGRRRTRSSSTAC